MKNTLLRLALLAFLLPTCKISFAESQENDMNAFTLPQKPSLYRNVFIEFLGASNIIGVSYDSRIKPGSPLGYRIGFGYAEGGGYVAGLGDNSLKGYTIPVGINYLFGSRASKFELGFGTNMGVYHAAYTEYSFEEVAPGLAIMTPAGRVEKNGFGYYFFFDLGYRLQFRNGFNLRVGVNPSFNFGGDCGVRKKPLMYPYLSLGYTFKNL